MEHQAFQEANFIQSGFKNGLAKWMVRLERMGMLASSFRVIPHGKDGSEWNRSMWIKKWIVQLNLPCFLFESCFIFYLFIYLLFYFVTWQSRIKSPSFSFRVTPIVTYSWVMARFSRWLSGFQSHANCWETYIYSLRWQGKHKMISNKGQKHCPKPTSFKYKALSKHINLQANQEESYKTSYSPLIFT